jgi:hypothetical protein
MGARGRRREQQDEDRRGHPGAAGSEPRHMAERRAT